MSREARDFIAWYNGLPIQRKVYPRSGAKAAREARVYLDWCEQQDVDPRRWCTAKHDATGWQFRIPLKHLVRSSPEFMEKFRAWGDNRRAEDDLQDKLNRQVIDETARPAGMTYFGESVKRALRDEPDICALHKSTRYNPESDWCRLCRVAPC
jgi:hypothetical protein